MITNTFICVASTKVIAPTVVENKMGEIQSLGSISRALYLQLENNNFNSDISCVYVKSDLRFNVERS